MIKQITNPLAEKIKTGEDMMDTYKIMCGTFTEKGNQTKAAGRMHKTKIRMYS